ncbi:MAG: NAD(+)--dinitrogen-reductase ADP-D-ribosyltransferase [Gammaproteobacteria bacterium]|nr:NAD(+)--dinitrogen-reductase ADP-D-ribosyltransferase [Gammaproteobacteria bacterium]
MTKSINKKIPVLRGDTNVSINHCNLPASILGGLVYNAHPVPLELDGVSDLHKNLFVHLSKLDTFQARQKLFFEYMRAHFQLDDLSQMGLSDFTRVNRKKINYQRIILGWHMNPDSMEGAVLKRWAESRFGLSPRFHKGPIRYFDDHAYYDYLMESAAGIYNTNAIESQLDVLYSYCQYELGLTSNSHITLYRGFNNLNAYEVLEKNGKNITLLLNNINSFSLEAETAEHFGDYVIEVKIPVYKVFCFNKILPKQINAENEYIVIGGIYTAEII